MRAILNIGMKKDSPDLNDHYKVIGADGNVVKFTTQ